jgi:hypothetical protein
MRVKWPYTPSPEEKDMFFINGYEILSQSVFDFLHSGYGGYVRSYYGKFHNEKIDLLKQSHSHA